MSTTSEPEPTSQTRTRSLLTLAGVAALVFVLTYLFAVGTSWGQRLDATALAGHPRAEHPRLARATGDLLTTVSVGSVLLLGGGIVLVALGRGRHHLAAAAGLLILGSDVTAEVLKRAVLVRPDLIGPDGRGLVQTFPSGHTAVATSLALAAVLVAPRRARGVVAALGGLYAVAIGEAVVLTGWHRPSDVIGSFLLVTVYAALAAAWLAADHARLVEGPAAPRPPRPVLSPIVATVGAIALAIGFIGFVGVIVSLRANRIDAVDLGAAYAAASAAILGVGIVVMATNVHLLRDLSLDGPPGRS